MTPYEAWHGRKPAVSHLRVFGSLIYVKKLNHVGKLDDRSTTGVFISYDEGVKGYCVLDPVTRVRMVRDVVFDEGRGWTWGKMVDDETTSSSTTSTTRGLGEWAALLRRACLTQYPEAQ
jgi:hypothetical protein